jgi:4-oxalocrotonate tautomerase
MIKGAILFLRFYPPAIIIFLKEEHMPVIKVEMTYQSKEKKKEIIEKLTQTMVEITNIPAQAFVVYINEYDSDSIGTGGITLSERK